MSRQEMKRVVWAIERDKSKQCNNKTIDSVQKKSRGRIAPKSDYNAPSRV